MQQRVRAGFVSFTEVAPGEHRSYNEWHLFDHVPEQYTIPGIVWGQRWVLTPALRAFRTAEPPLDRIHYVTLYLISEPVDETLVEFMALGRELRNKDRFHRHRTSHLSGPFTVRSWTAHPRVLVSGEAIPYRPHAGVHVHVEHSDDGTDVSAERIAALGRAPGVAGVWTFTSDTMRATWCWLDGEAAQAAGAIAPEGATIFSGALLTVDPSGPFDWFDGESPLEGES